MSDVPDQGTPEPAEPVVPDSPGVPAPDTRPPEERTEQSERPERPDEEQQLRDRETELAAEREEHNRRARGTQDQEEA